MYVAVELLTLIGFATLNLYLGFSTAIYWRRHGLEGAFSEYFWFLLHREALSWDLFLPAEGADAATSDAFRTAVAKPPSPNDEKIDEQPPVEPEEQLPHSDVVGEGDAADGVPAAERAADDPPEEEPSEPDELEALLRSPGEPQGDAHKASKPAAIAVFESTREQLQEFTQELDKLDHRLREVLASPTGEALEACGVSLSGAAARQLNQLRETFTPLLLDASPDTPSPARKSLESTISRTSDRIDALLANLAGLAFDAENPAATTDPLLEAYANSISAVHALRDELTNQLVTVVRDEVGLSHLATHLRSDQHTGLASRSGFETWIADLQENQTDENKASLVLIDIDSLSAVNRRNGATAGDGVVSAVAQFVAKARQREQLAARIAGQQFALVCGSTEARQLAETAERVRQSIEKTTFRYRGQTIRVTVSAAAAPIHPDDDIESLLERALTTVREAKSYGRNRTFLCEDECPSPVVPPEMVIDEQEVTL